MATISRVRVWDLPVRAFHWCLAIGVGVSLFTGLEGSAASMEVHIVSGQINLALIAFRLVWGFLGGIHARFGQFLRGPAATLQNLRDLAARTFRAYPGHTPAGGWMVLLMLAVIGVEASTGLFATDDIDIAGPLNYLVNDAAADVLTETHEFLYPVTITLVSIHILAIFGYRVLGGQRLVGPMVHGYKSGLDANDEALLAGRGLLVAAIVGALVYWVLS